MTGDGMTRRQVMAAALSIPAIGLLPAPSARR